MVVAKILVRTTSSLHSPRLLTFPDNRYLVENPTLSICNRWRRERGESELTMSDIGAQGDSPAS